MMSISEVKRLLKSEAISDAEADAIRDACYELAYIIVEHIRDVHARKQEPQAEGAISSRLRDQ